jgi:CubicO group peptidase (beta-lactamase class C family)
MSRIPTIHGHVDARFLAVADAFRDNFARRRELGASVCVWFEGEKVVDLWGGTADPTTGTRWQADTMCTVFSCTKGLAALCLMMLVDRGRLDYDARVADYWPEFAVNGKEGITVRTLLSHRAGLIATQAPITLDDIEHRPDHVDALLAAATPLWSPGTDQGYHGVTIGLYLSALWRRLGESRSLGQFFAEEIAGPLGLDLHIGLPPELESRVARLVPVALRETVTRVVPKLAFDRGRDGRFYRAAASGKDTADAFRYPKETGARGMQNFNLPRVHQLELLWANAIGNARGLAGLYGVLAEGGAPLVSDATLRQAHERPTWAACDRVLRKPVGWSCGFIKEEPHLFSPSPAAFGHPGAGGALGLADPTHRLGIGYVMNRMGHHVRSPRALALCHAVYDALGVRRS